MMMISLFLALFLPCAGMSIFFLLYLCIFWYVACRNNTDPTDRFGYPVKPAADKGLSAAELEKLPKVTGKELVLGTECAVCLDDIESQDPARLIPGCNHGFHLECANLWLMKHSACPICRAKLGPELFSSAENPC